MSHQRLYPHESINVNSRKIKKAFPMTSSLSISKAKETKGPDSHKYFVCDRAMKQAIILELKSKLMEDNEANQVSFSEFFNKLYKDENSFQQCNDVLKETLIRHIGCLAESSQELHDWRRRIRRWLKNSGNPETKNTCLVPPHKLQIFKEKLIPRLQNLAIRSTESARIEVLSVLEEIHREENKDGLVLFRKNAGKKHWWHDFLHANEEIKQIWKAKPIKRYRQKKIESDGTVSFNSRSQEGNSEHSANIHQTNSFEGSRETVNWVPNEEVNFGNEDVSRYFMKEGCDESSKHFSDKEDVLFEPSQFLWASSY